MTTDEIRARLEALGLEVGSAYLAKTDAGVALAVQIGASPEQWAVLLERLEQGAALKQPPVPQ